MGLIGLPMSTSIQLCLKAGYLDVLQDTLASLSRCGITSSRDQLLCLENKNAAIALT